MRRAVLVVALAGVAWLLFGARDASWAQQESIADKARQQAIASKVRLLGPGTEITVHLTDGSTLEGILKEVQDDAIVVTANKGGTSTTVLLAEIQRLDAKGKGGHTVKYVLIGVASAVGALIVLAVSSC